MTAAPETLSTHGAFGGTVSFHRHQSSETVCAMRFAVYLPPQAERRRVPVLWYLAGLTCTEETFMIKAGAQRVAAELGLALISPDTSPRGVPLPGDSDAWDFGIGAGFYLDATEEPWSPHYRMYSYITRELAPLVERNFPVDPKRQGIFGHSMGGHGALTIGLRNPGLFRSISAFAPISAPMHCPWGQKAFTGYIGADRERWREYDACELIRSLPTVEGRPPLLVDQGLADQFLEQQLMPERLEQACKDAGHPLTLRRHPGYDHGYYFISTFVENHLRHHARALLG
ncbi:MAG: S-formylglutathione hydrolase [Steroidobacteraceae bacterium]